MCNHHFLPSQGLWGNQGQATLTDLDLVSQELLEGANLHDLVLHWLGAVNGEGDRLLLQGDIPVVGRVSRLCPALEQVVKDFHVHSLLPPPLHSSGLKRHSSSGCQ